MTDHFEESTMTGTVGDVRLGGDQAQEPGHRGVAVEQRLVHVDVDQLGAALDLLARDVDRLVLGAVVDQPGELARAGDVGPLADVDEERCPGRDDQRLEAGQAGRARSAPGSRAAAGRRPPRRWRAMCSGVVPQQPPTRLSRPCRPTRRAPRPSPRASRRSRQARWAARRSGRRRSAGRRSARAPRRGARGAASAPRAQLSPTISGSAWRIAVPERVDGLARERRARRVDDRAAR